MIVYFKNNTSTAVTLDLGENHIALPVGGKISVDSDSNKMRFNCFANIDNSFKTLKLFSFIITGFNFVLNTFYDMEITDDFAEIELREGNARGEHLETYKYINVFSKGIVVRNRQFKVKDEQSAKERMSHAQKRERKATKYARALDIAQTVCYVGIPAAIIFFGVWYFSDIWTALKIIVPVTAIGLFISFVLAKLIKSATKNLDDRLAKDAKFDPYVNDDSLFENEYISYVINCNHEN